MPSYPVVGVQNYVLESKLDHLDNQKAMTNTAKQPQFPGLTVIWGQSNMDTVSISGDQEHGLPALLNY